MGARDGLAGYGTPPPAGPPETRKMAGISTNARHGSGPKQLPPGDGFRKPPQRAAGPWLTPREARATHAPGQAPGAEQGFHAGWQSLRPSPDWQGAAGCLLWAGQPIRSNGRPGNRHECLGRASHKGRPDCRLPTQKPPALRRKTMVRDAPARWPEGQGQTVQQGTGAAGGGDNARSWQRECQTLARKASAALPQGTAPPMPPSRCR